MELPDRIVTPLAVRLGIRYPILCAPMFLVSNVDMVVAAGEAGALGGFPSLNYRTTEELEAALAEIRRRTSAPFAVNLIVKAPRVAEDLAAIVRAKVPLVITSLGDPTPIVHAVHEYGGLVFCDVIHLKHALKAQAAGADAVIAVAAGAGGHAGKISPLVLVPWLRRALTIPVVCAGGIANGEQVAAAIALGADLAYVGTRFIASTESPAAEAYKQMIVRAGPEDVEFTPEITGHPANFLRESLEEHRAAALGPRAPGQVTPRAWKEVFSAGQTVALIDDVKPIGEIVRDFVAGFVAARERLVAVAASAGR
jgi:nitronate monooxygenase